MSRTSTPIRINSDGSRTITAHACCPRCERDLGDATEAEIAAIVVGRFDVAFYADECGCAQRTEAAS